MCIVTYIDNVELTGYPCNKVGLLDVCGNVGGQFKRVMPRQIYV